ncbi:WXG100 family type VII secretion target [Solwaraspora sp. WMMD1047]|uniref:WXG100 family type VII secretion target n=1 Tax=Solwaraspora sp. WMMD1047 TaxID=3016102 RepID=UPI002417F316|nr:WXG100 family type VII secretion target [Solwaraspora sp. WMMD1047]MDG4829497.1 WXG100 family type VII secretion target [Solwaraspora sp. WMMD1047]
MDATTTADRGRPVPWTDFARYPHADLIRMLANSDPNGVTAAGDLWAAVGRSLHDRADDLDRQLASFSDMWSGGAAEQYRTMIVDLAGGIRRVAAAALRIRDLVYTAGEALRAAWLTMPAEGGEAARQQAVLVMTELARRYQEVHEALPAALNSVYPPGSGPGGPAPGLGQPGLGHVVGQPGRPPQLFNHVFTAGIAAASAALGRQFVPARPIVPPPAPGTGRPPPDEPPAAIPAPVDPVPGSDLDALGGGGIGGGGFGGGGLGGGGGSMAFGGGAGGAAPAAYSALAGASGGGAEAASGFAGAAAGAGGAGRPGGMGMVPPMPMGMMGAGDAGAGSGRRIPPWLVETEDIWGEAAIVTAPVIGEDPDPGPPQWR